MKRGLHPELRRKAYREFRRALAWGIVKAPGRCQDCKREGVKLHGHHESYLASWDVTWLCPVCHARRHRGALH